MSFGGSVPLQRSEEQCGHKNFSDVHQHELSVAVSRFPSFSLASAARVAADYSERKEQLVSASEAG